MKVYSYLVFVLDPTVKLFVLKGFLLFCLYIHCVFDVPFSMATEFFSIQPGCIKVQLKDATCPRSLCVSMCECVHIFLNCLSSSLKTCKFILVKISRTCFLN